MSSVLFSGNSRFAVDFRAVIERSLAIASLPLNHMRAVKADLEADSTALGALDARFVALLAAVDALETSAGPGSLAASVSDPGAAGVTVAAGAMTGSYRLDISSLGAYSSAMSADALPVVADPYAQNISAAASFTLTVNGVGFNVTPAGDSLVDLAEAINAAGAGVEATVVNLGSAAAPDYRLSVQGTRLAADTIQLNDGAADLLAALATGAPASYRVNGSATLVESDSRDVALAPGLTVELLAESAVTITVARDMTPARDALSAFAEAYNAAVDELDRHRGQGGGALTGESLLISLAGGLRGIGGYDSGAGTVKTLAALGLELDSAGKLAFDSAAFDALPASDVLAFLGSAEGGGFLQAATEALNGAVENDAGSLKVALDSVADRLNRQDDLMVAEQDRIDLLRESLESQMAAADALIAALEQQALYMSNLFEAMRMNSGGRA